MIDHSPMTNARRAVRFRALPSAREVQIHNGFAVRRIRLSGGVQLAAAAGALMLLAWSLFAAVALSRTAAPADDVLDTRIAEIEAQADARAERIELRQRFLAAMIAGERDGTELAAFLPEVHEGEGHVHAAHASLADAEARQLAFVAAARAFAEARYRDTADAVQGMGLSPRRVERIGAAMGGPYEPLPEGTGQSTGDDEFRTLFQSWARLDRIERGVMSVPSQKPVDNLVFTSLYGVRSDPFRGSRAMHAGVDIPGPVGTPVYATADGIVGRAQYAGAYGNLVEVRHGRGIETRYAHLSRILVQPNSRVRRGDMIGHMGSTGRSTGSHLHYEVRIDGRAVDPTPFLRSSDFVLAVQDRVASETAQGGPEAQLADD